MKNITFVRKLFGFSSATFILILLCLSLQAQKVYTYKEYCNNSKQSHTRSEDVFNLSVSQVKNSIEQLIPTIYINSKDDVRAFAKEGETLVRAVAATSYLPLLLERSEQTKNLSTIIVKVSDKNTLSQKLEIAQYAEKLKHLKLIFIQCYFPVTKNEILNFIIEDPEHPVLILYQYSHPG